MGIDSTSVAGSEWCGPPELSTHGMHPTEPKIPCLTIISHPDAARVGERVVLWQEPEKEGEALLARHQLAFAMPGSTDGRTLDDPYVSRRALRFSAARFGGIRIDCSESGTRVVANDDWIPEDRVFLGVEVERGVVLILSERLALMLHNLDRHHQNSEETAAFGLVGENPRLLKVRREIARLAQTTDPVLLRGATGTGKKVTARAIHDTSDRRGQPFVILSMADATMRDVAVPLFKDRIRQAAGGTLLLDVAEKAPEDLQKEALKALATDPHDVRLCVAIGSQSSTRKRLDAAAGPLIESLVDHLVDIPPLDKRRDDASRLFFHYLRPELDRLGALERLQHPGAYAPPWMPVRLIARLSAYEWPCNVHQLRRVAFLVAREYHDKPHADLGSDLEMLLDGTAESPMDWVWPPPEEMVTAQREPEEVSEIELLSALRAHRWQAEPTASELGITPEALFSMIDKFSERTKRQKRARGRRGSGGSGGGAGF